MKRGEIWLLSLDPTLGAELKKTRPVVIVNDDALGILPLRIIVPLTDWKPYYVRNPWMVYIQPDLDNQLQKDSAADCLQIRSVSEQRFVRKIGNIGKGEMTGLEAAMKVVLQL